MKHCFYIALVAVIVALPGLALFGACSTSSPKLEAKAAIIDQLRTLQPNEAFIEQTTQYLEDYGFEVDVYQGDEVTVDLYHKLPTYGYKLIIFRVHSGLLGVDPKVTNRTWLFTAEPYSKTRHVTEQLTDQVTYAKTHQGAPWVFAISAKFITQSMKGQFANTAIVMMGCSCLYLKDLATAFIDKGASVYLAWDDSVDLDYVDRATAYLIGRLCVEKVTIKRAVTSTMNVIGPDPKYKAVLKYFPSQKGNKTLKQLIELGIEN